MFTAHPIQSGKYCFRSTKKLRTDYGYKSNLL